MKKILAAVSILALMVPFAACGKDNEDRSETEKNISSAVETDDGDEKEASDQDIPEETTESYHDEQDAPILQSCHKTISNSEKPEVTMVTLSGVCSGNIKKLASVEDLYNINVLHSGVVGLIGVPIELSCSGITDMELTFTYDPDSLRGVPENNLIFLRYDEGIGTYDEMYGELDTDSHTVSLKIPSGGVYMLVDAYQWLGCWGVDVSEYAYDTDRSAYQTDWERERNTGSIMDIVDKDWAMENAPAFHVSTAQELAGAVYYVNGIADGEAVSVTLENDIDLSGYDWVPMGWYNGSYHNFSGTVDGQGHTISNMKIISGYDDAGFIGYGLSTYVNNINFVNADVRGSSCTGVVGGQIYITDLWENITLTDCTVNGSSTDTGSVIGREAATAFKGCAVNNVTVNGEPFEYFSYRQKVVEETEVTETFKLEMKDKYVFTRDVHDGFRNLGWVFERNGVQLLDRSAENETEYDGSWLFSEPGTYHVYLNAFINGTYIRVSNLIEIVVE